MNNHENSIAFDSVHVREIKASDNRKVESLIRSVSSEFGCVGPGYSSSDTELKKMHETYSNDGSVFYVLVFEGLILGCGGIAPLTGGAKNICELRKMYFDKRLRGIGWGRELLKLCLCKAKSLGYKQCYLETIEAMGIANSLYRNVGFKRLDSPLGATGHLACDRWYLMNLNSLVCEHQTLVRKGIAS